MLAELSSEDIDAWVNNLLIVLSQVVVRPIVLPEKRYIGLLEKCRTKVIDSLSFMNDVWLPIKSKHTAAGPDRKGVWLIGCI